MYNLWCFVALNYYKITVLAIYVILLRFFVAIYALLCGEKLSQKLCLWRKKDKYHVCQSVILIIILVRSLNLLLGRICLIFPWQKSLAEYPSNTRVYNCHRCQVFQSTTWSYLPVQHFNSIELKSI